MEADELYVRDDYAADWHVLFHCQLRIWRYVCITCVDRVPIDMFPGNATYAGALAAIMANVVLIAYVIMAFKDDQAEQAEDAKEAKKEL